MQGFHHTYGLIVFVCFNLHDGFRLVVQFGADMSPCVFIILVLMQDGMNVYLPVVSPPHKFGYYFGGLAGRIDVIDEVPDTVNDDQSQVRYHADCLLRYCHSYFGRIFSKCQHLQVVCITIIRQACQSQDSIQNNLAMVLALFRVNVENLPFILREAGSVMQHSAIYQSSRSDGRDIEGLFAFGFPDGCAEVPQSPDYGIIHHQHGSRLLVCPGYADDRFVYVSFQFLRGRNIVVHLFHIPTTLLVLPYVLSQRVSARVLPQCSVAPGLSFRSPTICPVRPDRQTGACPV